MDWIVIEGVKPWDGRYELDLQDEAPTFREWGWIKRHSGYLPMTIEEGLRGMDPELFAVLALIALRRAGRIQPDDVPGLYERFQDVPTGGTIRFESDTADEQEEADAGPPPPSSPVNNGSSGTGSKTSSDSSAEPPKPPGHPLSVTSGSHRPQLGS